MTNVRCDVKDCPNKQGSICTNNNVNISSHGSCLSMEHKRKAEGECWTCGNCQLYQLVPNHYRPYCQIGNSMSFKTNNECWIKKDSF